MFRSKMLNFVEMVGTDLYKLEFWSRHNRGFSVLVYVPERNIPINSKLWFKSKVQKSN